MRKRIEIKILPNYFLNGDGTFNKDEAIHLDGKIAGICYDKEGFSHLEGEPTEKTDKRVDMTINNGHHSVYGHTSISFDIKNLPKALAMVLNNEHEYNTSEKSLRYTPVISNGIITNDEERLYNKWLDIFKTKIREKYGNVYSNYRINKLAQENARYLITVFTPTEMIYTTSLRQINYIASWMDDYITSSNMNNIFERKLSMYMDEFINELDEVNVLDDRLMKNEKQRKISLFGKDLGNQEEYFGNVYSTNYKGSFAELAQAQRHRTLDYKMEFLDEKEFYIPPIIEDDDLLVKEWLSDMGTVEEVIPQGELVSINETGKYDDFILKCKERLCSAAQLEIMRQTRETLIKYKEYLEKSNNPLKDDIIKYTHGARCTFPDFTCTEDCNFIEGKRLIRKI